MRNHTGAGNTSSGRLGADATSRAGYYWLGCRGSESYAAWDMFNSANDSGDPNVHPTQTGGVTNSGRVVRPIVESLLDSEGN